MEKGRILLRSHSDFYTIQVVDHLHSFDIDATIKDNDYFHDDVLTYIESYSKQFQSNCKPRENEIEEAFDELIVNLLKKFNNTTSSSSYLEEKFRPDCTFT
jgi:hypothetical protein